MAYYTLVGFFPRHNIRLGGIVGDYVGKGQDELGTAKKEKLVRFLAGEDGQGGECDHEKKSGRAAWSAKRKNKQGSFIGMKRK